MPYEGQVGPLLVPLLNGIGHDGYRCLADFFLFSENLMVLSEGNLKFTSQLLSLGPPVLKYLFGLLHLHI